MPNEHRWETTGLDNWSRCAVCHAERQYDAMPGWPGSYVYFLASGALSEGNGSTEPPCAALPVDGLFQPAPEPATAAAAEDGFWFHAAHRDDERWTGPFVTREDCVADGMAQHVGSFWIDEGTPTHVSQALGWFGGERLARMEEDISEYLADNGWADQDDVDAVTFRQKPEALRELLLWAEKYLEVARYYSLNGRAELVTRLCPSIEQP